MFLDCALPAVGGINIVSRVFPKVRLVLSYSVVIVLSSPIRIRQQFVSSVDLNKSALRLGFLAFVTLKLAKAR